MLTKKRKSEIQNALNSLEKTDTYSLLLFALYQLRGDSNYSTLSELCYVLDGKNLTKFLSYFGGQTITIPTVREFRLMVQALLLYQFVNLEKGSLDEALSVVGKGEFDKRELLEAYNTIITVVSQFNFKRGN